MAKKIALLVGVSEYEPGLNPLPGSVLDVDAMQRVLVHPELGGFDKTDVTVLKNPQRQTMEEALYHLFNNRKKDDLLLFYFSGHGIKDESGRLYLATRATHKDSIGRLVKPSAVAATSLHENIDESRSQHQVIILDCCFSGAIAQGMTVKDDGNVNLKHYLGGKGRAILTSSTATEYSFGSEIVGHEDASLSVYTRYLVEGIEKGAADADGDGWIAVEELHEYATNRVKEAAPSMTPKFYPVEEGYKILLARSPQHDPKLKYRKEVQTKAEQGQGKFSGIARQYLEDKQVEWEISAEEAQAIEDEVLQPYREYEDKLQKYEQVLAGAVQVSYPLSEAVETELKDYQQHLGLRDSDIAAMEARILEPLRAQVNQQSAVYQEKLVQYEREFRRAIDVEYPFSNYVSNGLKDFQKSLGLKNEDIERVEHPIRTQKEAEYHQRQEVEKQKLREEQNRLKREQEKLEYQQNLQRYDQEFRKAIESEYPFSSYVRDGLQNFQKSLGLKSEDVEQIEHPIRTQKEAEYHQRQKVEEQKNREEQERLKREQEKLEYQRSLQRYEQEFRKAIEAEYPLSQHVSEGLNRFQQSLRLRNENILQIEQPLRKAKEADHQRQLREEELRQKEKRKQEAGRQRREQEKNERESILRHRKEQNESIGNQSYGHSQENSQKEIEHKLIRPKHWKKKIIIAAVIFLGLTQVYGYSRYKIFPTSPLFTITSLPSSQFLERAIHSGQPNSVQFSPDGQYLASAISGRNIGDGAIHIWKVATGEEFYSFYNSNSSFVDEASFSPDGKYLASDGFSSDSDVQIWEISTRQIVKTFSTPDIISSIRSIQFSPDGQYLAVAADVPGGSNGFFTVWDVDTENIVATITDHHDIIWSIQFSPDGKYLASAGSDAVTLWELATKNIIHTLPASHSVSFSPDGQYLATTESTGDIAVWNTATWEKSYSLQDFSDKSGGSARLISFSPNGQYLASTTNRSSDGTVKVWDTSARTVIHTLSGHSDFISSLSFSPGGKFLASGGYDKTIKIWRMP